MRFILRENPEKPDPVATVELVQQESGSVVAIAICGQIVAWLADGQLRLNSSLTSGQVRMLTEAGVNCDWRHDVAYGSIQIHQPAGGNAT